MTIWSRPRPSARAGVSAPSMRPVRRNSCCAPPAAAALTRVGLANRRSLTGGSVERGLLDHGLGLLGLALDELLVRRARGGPVGVRGRGLRRLVGGRLGQHPLDLGRVHLLRLGRGVELGDLGQLAVGVRVAVGVLDLDVVAEPLGDADLGHLHVADRDDRRAGVGVDREAAAVGAAERDRAVAARRPQRAARDLVGVGGLGRDREAALGEAGERADEVGRQAADDLRAQQHAVDVPVGVVVGEDGLADVRVGAGGLQVARGGEDRVDRVVRVHQPVVVAVDAVGLPRRGHELHPALRAGGGDVEVAAVVGLDLVDRGQQLPADAVLRARGLVDRQQERRDPELVDEEVRDADLGRAGLGERVRRVVGRGRVGLLVGPVVVGGLGRRRRRRLLDLARQRLGVGAAGLVGRLLGLLARRLGLDSDFVLPLSLSCPCPWSSSCRRPGSRASASPRRWARAWP